MNAELAINYILCNNATFRAHVGTTAADARVYYDVAPQAATLPYTILRESSVDPNDTKDDNGHFDFGYVEVRHFAAGRLKVAQMATDARAALDRVVAAGTYQTVVVESIGFVTQFSDAEEIEDGIQHVKEQHYKVIVRA